LLEVVEAAEVKLEDMPTVEAAVALVDLELHLDILLHQDQHIKLQ